jgi:hypothetical protein
MDYAMNDPGDFLPETETTVPIVRGPGEGKVVGVLRDQSTFKVLSEETGGAYAILEQMIPAGHGRRSTFTATRRKFSMFWTGSSKSPLASER